MFGRSKIANSLLIYCKLLALATAQMVGQLEPMKKIRLSCAMIFFILHCFANASEVNCEKIAVKLGYSLQKTKYEEYHCGKMTWKFEGKSAEVIFLHRDFSNVSTLDLLVVDNIEKFKILAKLDSDLKLEPFGEHFLSFTKNEFALGKLGKIFSIKSVVHGCGAGGSLCGDENVNVFVVDKNKIKRVLNTQVSYSALYGGEWHEDGTREHIPEDWNSNLCLDTKNNPPLLIKTLDQNKLKKQVFVFDEKSFTYKTNDKNVMTSVSDK